MNFYSYMRQNASICVGNIIEWYDLNLYIVCSTIIGKLFFPTLSKHEQTLATMLIFSLGIIARNIGGWFFGRLTLRLSSQTIYRIIIRMCIITTLLIAVLPTYRQIGISAAGLLILLRFLQGFCAGAQYPGALSMLFDRNKQPASGCALAHITSLFGYCLAGVVYLILHHALADNNFSQYGWRIAFASSIILIFVAHKAGPLLRSDWSKFQHAAAEHVPLQEIIKNQGRSFLKIIFIAAIAGVLYFCNFVFLQKILENFTTLSQIHILEIQTIAWGTSCISVWLFAKLIKNNKFHYNMLAGCIAILISALITPELIKLNNIFGCAVASLLLITSNSLLISGIAPYYCAAFTKITRFSATAISYNLGTTVSGVIAPLVISYSLQSNDLWNYCVVLIAFALAGILTIKFTRHKTINR